MQINGITDIARFLTDEAAAQQALADLRWPDGNVVCPLDAADPETGEIISCGGTKVYAVSYKRKDKDGNVIPTVRKQWKCGKCRQKFSVTSKSIFEGAHIPVGKWIYAIFLMCSSKKGVSANQLARELNVTYKSAWFMCHRVREAMLQEPMAGMLGGGPDAIVELDETYVGGKLKNNRHKNRTAKAGKKTAVMTLIDREGDVKTVKVPNVRKNTLQSLARPIVDQSATIITDAHLSYEGLAEHFHGHHVVDHSKTFVRGVIFHTNFAESYHSLLKRGIIGSFHHVSDKHLPRYLAEFDRRWNTRKERDGARTVRVIETAIGKRLTYSETVG
ncbi:putative transposase for insertion sequence element [Sphingobium herbicidovorans NBRC 16415]|uniref:Putative transposase for insertion sequence element n=1 Tax=Sphingobium herbicidovorans (strain ATCC 700291 / DSM 11019 / CCUG 56400 / KCTC 2939 / LMG 18315 / NBRC 16415 / MH) TaxID=1219045 RepID=A0A086PA11_SPHHM|nr:IS1595 family transposase [Sphingobium herbicidovorans]KFG90225.1 putative transposase for insertion sequence element [Sphingobium herbicidovorans NBRC 16415]KFG90229.1 putative transposase for insertion sequence element [Sphingobium herbicidovorans NBRC 16415]